MSFPSLKVLKTHCFQFLPRAPGGPWGPWGPGAPWLPLFPASPLVPRGSLRSHFSWMSLSTWEALVSRLSYVATGSIWWKWVSVLCQKKNQKKKQTKKHALADIWLLFLLKLIVTNSSFWESKCRAIFLLFVVYSEFLLNHSLLEWHWLTQSDEMMTMSMLGYIKSLFLRQVSNTTFFCLFPLAVFIVKILSVLTCTFLYVLILNSQYSAV